MIPKLWDSSGSCDQCFSSLSFFTIMYCSSPPFEKNMR